MIHGLWCSFIDWVPIGVGGGGREDFASDKETKSSKQYDGKYDILRQRWGTFLLGRLLTHKELHVDPETRFLFKMGGIELPPLCF